MIVTDEERAAVDAARMLREECCSNCEHFVRYGFDRRRLMGRCYRLRNSSAPVLDARAWCIYWRLDAAAFGF